MVASKTRKLTTVRNAGPSQLRHKRDQRTARRTITVHAIRLRKVERFVTRACPGTLALIRHPRRRFYWSHILYNAYLQCTNHHSPCTTRSTLHTVRLSPTDRTRMQRACIDCAPDSDPAHAPAAHPHARLGQEMRIAPALARAGQGHRAQRPPRGVHTAPIECAPTERARESHRARVQALAAGKEVRDVMWVWSGLASCRGSTRARAGSKAYF